MKSVAKAAGMKSRPASSGRVFLHHFGGWLLSTIICAVAGILKKAPNDATILSVAAVELSLFLLVGSIIRVASGEQIAGEPWEFWGYLLTALILPISAVYWSIGADPLEQLRPGGRRRHGPGNGRPHEPDLVLTWKRQKT